MPRHVCTVPLLATLVALTTACANTASAPRAAKPAATPTAAGPDCRQLGAQIAQTEQARLTAQENQKDAWKAVAPFAVAARYAKSKAAAGQADQQLVALKTQYRQQGCERHGI